MAPDQTSAIRVRRAGRVGIATLTSRVLGLVRDHLFAKLFGAGWVSDAFVIAYRIPNLLRDLFAEGALSSAFVPTFTQIRARDGAAAAWRLVDLVLSALLVVVGLLTVAGILFAPSIVNFLAPGFSARDQQYELTVLLTRWLMPFLLLVSLAAVARGVLNSHHRYFLPALAPALFNGVAIAAGIGLSLAGLPPLDAILGWALATLVGGVVQFAVQLPSLYRLGFRLRAAWDPAHQGLRRILKLMGPAAVGLAAVQVNILVNTILASLLESGAPTWLQYGFRLVYLPVGVVGVAVATVSTVSLSSYAAAGDPHGFQREIVGALRLTAFLTIPATFGLVILGPEIVSLLFEYGEFTAGATEHTAVALACYSLGLFFFSAIKVVVPAFYALDRVRVPVLASVLGVVANITWSLATYRQLGYVALAFGPGLAGIVQLAVLSAAMRDQLPRKQRRQLIGAVARIVILAVAMGLAVWPLKEWLLGIIDTQPAWGRLLVVMIPIGVGVLVVMMGGRLLGLPESRHLLGLKNPSGDR